MQPGGFDLSQLMASAQQMQAEVGRAQASLEQARVTGSAGGGLVRADVNGNGELVGLVIDPSVVDPADTETLADLVVAAVRDGVRAAGELTRRAMSSVAGDLMGGIGLPGLQLPGLMGDPEISDGDDLDDDDLDDDDPDGDDPDDDGPDGDGPDGEDDVDGDDGSGSAPPARR